MKIKNLFAFFTAVLFAVLFAQISLSAGTNTDVRIKRTASEIEIELSNATLSMLFEGLQEQGLAKIHCKGKPLPEEPLNLSLSGHSLMETLKLVLKSSSVNNYLLNFKEKSDGGMPDIDLHILSIGKTTSGEKTAIIQQGAPPKSGMPSQAETLPSEPEKQAEWIRNHYSWEDDQTRNLAGHLVEIMPEPVRAQGFEALTRMLDGQEGKAIDENTLIDSMINTVPENMKPVMRNQMQTFIEDFKGTGKKIPDRSPDDLFYDYMYEQELEK